MLATVIKPSRPRATGLVNEAIHLDGHLSHRLEAAGICGAIVHIVAPLTLQRRTKTTAVILRIGRPRTEPPASPEGRWSGDASLEMARAALILEEAPLRKAIARLLGPPRRRLAARTATQGQGVVEFEDQMATTTLRPIAKRAAPA